MQMSPRCALAWRAPPAGPTSGPCWGLLCHAGTQALCGLLGSNPMHRSLPPLGICAGLMPLCPQWPKLPNGPTKIYTALLGGVFSARGTFRLCVFQTSQAAPRIDRCVFVLSLADSFAFHVMNFVTALARLELRSFFLHIVFRKKSFGNAPLNNTFSGIQRRY